jgi:hypothetical protein
MKLKFSSLVKAYVWAELGFIGYLLLRKEPLDAGLPAEGQQALSDLKRALEEKTK